MWPQGSSGVATLTKEERLRGMEVLAKAVKGKRLTLVLGVQGKDTAEMLEYARRADALGTDAMIAMPPTTGTSMDDYRAYFRALGGATTRPVIVQTSGGAKDLPPSVELIVELAREFPHMAYVKEESEPLVQRMQRRDCGAAGDEGDLRREPRHRLPVRDAARAWTASSPAWGCMPT